MRASHRTTMKICLCLLLPLFSIHAARAQEKVKAGVELDVLPYLTGGYFGAAWVGKGHLRTRALFARVHMPDFIVRDGFTNNTIRSYALLEDYFLKKDQTGFWLGSGLVLWDGKIQTDQRLETASYQTYLLNGSLGYVFNLSQRFYLSPWAGLSLRVGGDRHIPVDTKTFDPPLLDPEMSVKFGYRF